MAGKKIKGGEIIFTISDDGTLVQLGKASTKAGKELGSVAKNVQESDRRLKSLSNQTSNATKGFAKQAQTISGGLVPIYATIAAQAFAIGAAFRFMSDSFQTKNLVEGQKQFGAITGNAFKTITTEVQDATANMLGFQEAAQAVAIGTAAGLSSGQLEQLGTAAKNVSLALGRDLTDSFNRLVRGVTKAEPELLDELGIVLRLDPALKKYALALNKSVSDLNQFEKSQAIANEVLEQAETKFGRIAEIMNEDAFVLQQFGKEFDDLVIGLQKGLATGLTPVLAFLKDNFGAFLATLGILALPILRQIIPDLNQLGTTADANFKQASKAADEAAASARRYSQSLAAAKGGQGGAGIAMQSVQDIQGTSFAGQIKFKGGENQLSSRQLKAYENSLAKRVGIAQNMNKKELAAFRLFLADQRAALTASGGAQVSLVEQFELRKRAAYAKTAKWFATYEKMKFAAAAKFAKATDILLKGFFWAGIITLIITAGVELYKFFRSMDKEGEKARKQTQAVVENLGSLTEELNNMNQVRGEGLLNVRDTVTQIGNALQSFDVAKRIAQFNTEVAKGMDNATKAQFVAAAQELAALEPDFAALVTAFQNGETITGPFAEKMKALATQSIAAGQATKQLVELQRALDQAIKNTLNSMASLKYESLLTNLSQIIEAQTMIVAAEKKQAARVSYGRQEDLFRVIGGAIGDEGGINKSGLAAIVEYTKQGAKQREEIQKLFNLRAGVGTEAQKLQTLEMQILGTRGYKGITEEQLTAAFKVVSENYATAVQSFNDTQKIISDDEKNLETNIGLQETYLEFQKRQLEIDQSITEEKIKQVQLARQGIQISQAIINNQNKQREQENQIALAQIAYDEALALQAMAQKDSPEAARAKAAVAMTKLKLDLENENLITLEKQFETAAATARIQLQYARSKAGSAKFGDLTGYGQGMLAFAQTDAGIGIAQEVKDAGGSIEEATRAVQQFYYETQTVKLEWETLSGIAGRLTEGLADDMANALIGIAEGTKTVKEAFADMAKSILVDITKMIIKALVLQAVMAAITAMTGGTGAVFNFFSKALGARQGGIMSPGGGGYRSYSDGGISDGPTSGYPAVLHGKEAVVPLPNGRSIPVDMKGGTGNVNNINVNIDMKNGSSNITADQGNAFGAAISAAVIDEIAKQQRSGGLLSGT